MVWIFLFMIYGEAQARPNYAAENRILDCTTCHFSPTGGSARNLVGKTFGTHGYELPTWAAQEYLYLDWRALFFKAEHSDSTREGTGIMEATLSGIVNLVEESGRIIRFVLSHSITGFGGARETYLQWQWGGVGEVRDINSLSLGRLQPPFGIRIDEHRTYGQLLQMTTWNDFFMGVQASGNPSANLHYDVALTNGESEPAPERLQVERSNRWGGMVNLRWLSTSLPLFVGVSALQVERLESAGHAHAEAFYTVVSVHRWTAEKIPLDVLFQWNTAKNFNGANPGLQGMIGDANYLQSVASSRSQALWLQLEWTLNPHWVAISKFDEMILDRDYLGDYYRRYGLGVRNYFGANLYWESRFEIATADTPATGPSQATQNALWAFVRASF